MIYVVIFKVVFRADVKESDGYPMFSFSTFDLKASVFDNKIKMLTVCSFYKNQQQSKKLHSSLKDNSFLYLSFCADLCLMALVIILKFKSFL